MSLHYGDPHIAIGVVFAVLALVLAAVFVLIAVQAGSEVVFERVHEVGYWLRKRWLALLGVLGVLVVGLSLFALPYASGGSTGRTVVKVTGGQFFWSLQPGSVPVGTRVRFDVGAVDVNHGFGLYDPHGHLIGSVQAMPGYNNKLDLTLSEAGVYRIRCLEYCGLMHSIMQSSFGGDPPLMASVTAPSPATSALHPRAGAFTADARPIERRVGLLFAATGIALILLMGVLGLTMRLTQATVVDLSPAGSTG